MAEWNPTPVGSFEQPVEPIDPARPWTVPAAAVLVAASAIGNYLELDARTQQSDVTISIGGPAFSAAVAIGLLARWRSAWWVGVATTLLGLVLTPFLFELAGGNYALVNAACVALVLALLAAPATRAWMLDQERTELRLGSLLGTVVALSIAVTILVSAT